MSSIIYPGGYAALPAYADDMIATWLAAGGRPRAGLIERPFMQAALWQHAQARHPTDASLQPVLLSEAG